MNEFILSNELPLRLSFFFGIFLVIAIWEIVFPRRALTQSKVRRWINNLAVVVIDNLALRILFPILAVGLAVIAERNEWGVFNIFEIPVLVNVALSVIIFDFLIYLQHVMFHMIPLLWRLHRMHHIDPDYDVTTASRFHPIEIILSMIIKMAAILVIGPAPIAIICFEIILNGSAMFNHGNIKLPQKIDAIIRKLIVTPDMHRVHHSIYPSETNSNYGFFLSLWDQWMGTYKPQPKKGHELMIIGLEYFRDLKFLNLHWLILIPFLDASKYK